MVAREFANNRFALHWSDATHSIVPHFSFFSCSVVVPLKVKIGPVSKQSYTQLTPVAPEKKAQHETCLTSCFELFRIFLFCINFHEVFSVFRHLLNLIIMTIPQKNGEIMGPRPRTLITNSNTETTTKAAVYSRCVLRRENDRNRIKYAKGWKIKT